jgi:hypothetical protein
LAALFGVITAVCLYQAYRTNRQILKYYTPAPAVDLRPEFETYAFRDEDFVLPFDPTPAAPQLIERTTVISDRIAELRSRGEQAQADTMQARLDQLLARRQGPYPEDGKQQLHALGLYGNGPTRIRLTYTGAPVVLALCSYERMRWTIETAPGVQLKKVVLCGYEEQSVEGLADDVLVEGNVGGETGRDYRFYAHAPAETAPAAQRLAALTGLSASTFLTAHESRVRAFEIGPGNSEWSAQMTLRAMEPLFLEAIRERRAAIARELVGISFTDVVCTPAGRLGGFRTNIAVQSLFGPYASTLRPVNGSTTEFVVDPRGPSFFGWSQSVVTIDPDTGSMTAWPVAGLDQDPRETRLAFDTKRNRLLLWGRAGLVAVDILKKEAEIVRKGTPGLVALTYSPDDDLLYACCAPDFGSSNRLITEIRAYNHRGADVSCTHLAVPIAQGETKLTLLGGKLLIAHLGSYDANHNLIPSDINYVVDPKTGALLLACRRKAR